MPEIEDRLTALAGAIAWPDTPRLSLAVGRPIAVEPRRAFFVPRWAMAAAAVLVIVASLLAYAPTRTAIADWVNLHIGLSHTTALPTPSPLPSGTLGSNLGLGTRTTLAGAQSQVTWHIVVPGQLGSPDAVYLLLPPDGASGGEVSLVYATSPGIPVSTETGVALLVTEARGSVNEQFFQKTLNDATTIEPVTVNGHQGWWISGQPHNFVFIDAAGNPRFETLRLATNTLVIDDGGTIVRIEGHMTRAQALQIAGTLA
ncbi:MAG TPA: hypothetical protein VGV88_12690 [Candidatus Dormibacteraeota bacterium]|nr:hypothetical protein [Candidatus Dormibacteraeota bacterium]